MTSHDVVSFIRRTINFKKVGHTGTLDPMAAGVLPICIGKGTRIVEFLQEDRKTYRAEITLGTTTDTQDCWGEIQETREVNVTKEQVEATILSFLGEIHQVPPMFSALKVNGRKLVDLAREGKTVEREARVRYVYQIDIINIGETKAVFELTCSKGTYIRTLCHDIGELLNCGAHMSFLLRVSSGNFRLEDSYTLEELRLLKIEGNIEQAFQPIEKGLPNYNKIIIDESTWKKVKNGVKLNLYKFSGDSKLEAGDKVLVFYGDDLIGLAETALKNNYYSIIIYKSF